MKKPLILAEVPPLLSGLKQAVKRPECWACDCVRVFLAQLELDSSEEVSGLIAPLKVPTRMMHGCLGCYACPPVSMYADYLRTRRIA
jgi:hypothetical protein